MLKRSAECLAAASLLVCLSSGLLYAQGGVLWSKTYGSPEQLAHGKVYLTKLNENYSEPARTSPDYHTKVFTENVASWTKLLGAPDFEKGRYSIETADGGKITVSYKRLSGGFFDVNVAYHRGNGRTAWRKMYTTRPEFDNELRKIGTNRRAVIGWELTFSAGAGDVYRLYFTTDPLGPTSQVDGELPSSFDLKQNYPNPFNPTTTISYAIPESEYVTLKIYDLLGREVATLVDKIQAAGQHTIQFDATALASGIYFYKIQAGDFADTKKMTLVR